MLVKTRDSQYYQGMGNFAPIEIALVVLVVTLIGLFLELVREGRASKARRERTRLLRPNQSVVCRVYLHRGLDQWQYQMVTPGDDKF
jgi:hypothetical protein